MDNFIYSFFVKNREFLYSTKLDKQSQDKTKSLTTKILLLRLYSWYNRIAKRNTNEGE